MAEQRVQSSLRHSLCQLADQNRVNQLSSVQTHTQTLHLTRFSTGGRMENENSTATESATSDMIAAGAVGVPGTGQQGGHGHSQEHGQPGNRQRDQTQQTQGFGSDPAQSGGLGFGEGFNDQQGGNDQYYSLQAAMARQMGFSPYKNHQDFQLLDNHPLQNPHNCFQGPSQMPHSPQNAAHVQHPTQPQRIYYHQSHNSGSRPQDFFPAGHPLRSLFPMGNQDPYDMAAYVRRQQPQLVLPPGPSENGPYAEPAPPLNRMRPPFLQLLDNGRFYITLLPPNLKLTTPERESLTEVYMLLKILSQKLVEEEYRQLQAKIVNAIIACYERVRVAQDMNGVREAIDEATWDWRGVEFEEQHLRWLAGFERTQRERREREARRGFRDHPDDIVAPSNPLDTDAPPAPGAHGDEPSSIMRGSMMERFAGVPYNESDGSVADDGVFRTQVSAGIKPPLSKAVEDGKEEYSPRHDKQQEERVTLGDQREPSLGEMMAVMQASRARVTVAIDETEQPASDFTLDFAFNSPFKNAIQQQKYPADYLAKQQDSPTDNYTQQQKSPNVHPRRQESSTNVQIQRQESSDSGSGTLRSAGHGRIGLSQEFAAGEDIITAADDTMWTIPAIIQANNWMERWNDWAFDVPQALKSTGHGRFGLFEEYMKIERQMVQTMT